MRMIDFFWKLICLANASQLAWFGFVALVVSIFFWLGIFFIYLYSRTRFRKLGAVLWSLLAFFILGGVVWAWLNVQIIDERYFQTLHIMMILSSIVPLYLMLSALGRVFNRKKILHWIFVALVYILAFFLVGSFSWLVSAVPYGEYRDESISQKVLEKSDGYDFEIQTKDLGMYESKIMTIRVKGDSAYCRVNYALCPYTLHWQVETWFTEDRTPLEVFETPWILLDDKISLMVNDLKNRIVSYEPELVSEWLYTDSPLEGFCTDVSVSDFKNKSRRSLMFCNASVLHVSSALAIEKNLEKLWPLREMYTKLSADEAMKKCMESQKK